MAAIDSQYKSKVKLARSLRDRKAREREKLFLVEGIHAVGSAIEAKAKIEYLLYCPDLLSSGYALKLVATQEAEGLPCYETTAEVFETLAEKENPQGILAVIHQNLTPLSSLAPQPSSLFVALISPQDPGNVGSILRTVDAASADGLLLLDGGVDVYHPSAVRAGMGAHFWKPIVQASFKEFVNWGRQHRVHIYGSSAHAKTDHREGEYQRPCSMLLGSEREGLTEEQMAACEQVVRLPMRGHATSLNLAVAAGILIYQIAMSK